MLSEMKVKAIYKELSTGHFFVWYGHNEMWWVWEEKDVLSIVRKAIRMHYDLADKMAAAYGNNKENYVRYFISFKEYADSCK